MTLYSQLTQPLISDLQLELLDGTRIHLNHSFVLAPGLPGVGQNDGGDRPPDSQYVVRSADEIPEVYSINIPGLLMATSPTALLDELDLLNRQLKQVRKLWRGDRCYIEIDYGLLPQPEMQKGWLSANVVLIFRIHRLAWLRPDGTEVFG